MKYETDEGTLHTISQNFMEFASKLSPIEWADYDAALRHEFSKLFFTRNAKYMWHICNHWYVTLFDHYEIVLDQFPSLKALAKRMDNAGHHVLIIRSADFELSKGLYVLRMDTLFYFHDGTSDFEKETLPYFLTVFEKLYGVD